MSGHRQARRVVTAVLVALAAAAFVVPAVARADDTCTIDWVGGSGSWTTPARWSPARVPTADDAVCIVRAAGAGPVSVRLPGSTQVESTTVRDATLSLAGTAVLDVSQVVASRAVLTGGGTLRGSDGILDIRGSRLAGVHVASPGRLTLGGQVLVTGGTTIDASGFTDLLPGVRVVDGDGNPANHLGVSRFPLYLTGSVFVGVALGLTDVALVAQGDVVLASLDDLDADGYLHAATRTRLQLGASSGGSLTLPRTVTRIGARVDVFGDDLRTPDGGDALAALARIDGSLSVGRDLVTGTSLAVTGSLSAGAELAVPAVVVHAGASFTGARVTGALTCAGRCGLTGAHLGALTLLPGASTTTDLTTPVVVDGAARLDGRLEVSTPFTGGPKPGKTFVLLTAARGVRGSFDAVTTNRPHRTVTLDVRPTWVTGTLGVAA